MTPTRRSSGGYQPPRSRRELIVAVLGVLVVALFTVALVWVLAPDDEGPAPVPSPGVVTTPTQLPPSTLTPASTAAGG